MGGVYNRAQTLYTTGISTYRTLRISDVINSRTFMEILRTMTVALLRGILPYYNILITESLSKYLLRNFSHRKNTQISSSLVCILLTLLIAYYDTYAIDIVVYYQPSLMENSLYNSWIIGNDESILRSVSTSSQVTM